MSSSTLILAALRDELWPAIRRLQLVRRADHFTGTYGHAGTCDRHSLFACVTGLGAARATAAARDAVAIHRPARLILIGFSGALSPVLQVGDVLRPVWVRNAQGRIIRITRTTDANEAACPVAVESADGCIPGQTLLTSDHLIHDPAEKRRLGETSGASIVDMETFAIAEAACEMKLPLTVIRAVSDDATTALPPRMSEWVTPNGSPRVGKVLAALLRRPGLLPVLLQMRRHTRLAATSLAQELQRELAGE